MLGVMVNACDFAAFDGGAVAAVDSLFHRKSLSQIDVVRVAVHPDEVEAAEPAVRHLAELGYKVGLTLMQVGDKPRAVLTEIARRVEGWRAVEVFYFVDSLGAMAEDDVRRVVSALADGWTGAIGFGARDNCQKALANTLAAFEAGASWLDAAILGMGRGAGNTRMEHLISDISRRIGRFRPAALYPLVLEDFQKLQDKYRWGTNLVYYLSAQYGIDPSYAQQMLDDGRYSTEQILGALEQLRRSGGGAYSAGNLRHALAGSVESSEGSYDARGWATERDVLIVGAGSSVMRHRDDILDFINKVRPLVLSLNVNRVLPPDVVTAYVACHQARLMIEAHEYRQLDKVIVAPSASIPSAVREQFEGVRTLDYGLAVANRDFVVNPKGCVLPAALAAPYALAFVTAAGARRVFLAGFDGYGAEDPRQVEMIQMLEAYRRVPNSLPLVALTSSSYPVQQSSLHVVS
jgi:4-hydroxy 2-oxovalerate aldolase